MHLNYRSIQRPLIFSLVCLGLAGLQPSRGADETPVDVHMRTPAEELETIQMPAGYHLELVAADPDIISPVLLEWDGNGRMYVAEMRSYMLDINGTKAHTPISRVSRWEQSRNDGIYDKHTVYADGLMLPRMILPLDDRVLIRETDTKDIYCYRDTNGDGISDEKTKFYEGGKQEGNLEHQPSGLIWDIDNWIYVSAQKERFRYTRGKFEKQPLPMQTGQWGIATTDTGQLIFNRAGSEQPAYFFQVMPQYGEVRLAGELSKDFEKINPIENLTDVEGGEKRLRPQGGLNRFSGCAGGSIYRGDALPADLYGDYILPEPVGRLIRRAKVNLIDGKWVISNPDNDKEFIASTDPNFRPVWSATGPDGLLYFCDMYHGIIQEANWTKEGTYLRPQIKKYGLQKNINKGRIWRLVHDGSTPRKLPRMLDETPAQLVEHLADANGWWRDTAQKLIILRCNGGGEPSPEKSPDRTVVPALVEMAMSHANPIARLHALWTLEGLDAVTDELLIAKLADADPRCREAAVRIAEPFVLKNDAAVINAIKALATDSDAKVAGQLCMSMLTIKAPQADDIVASSLSAHRDGAGNKTIQSLVDKYHENQKKAAEEAAKNAEMAKLDKSKGELFVKGRDAYAQTCIACHGPDGKGMPTAERNGNTLAPPLAGSRRLLADKQVVARIVLHGLVGANNGTVYPGQMASFKWATDEWLASILTYARNDWGNKAPAITPADIAEMRKVAGNRSQPFTIDELYSAAQATAAVTPNGARVVPGPGEVVLDPTTAQLHGKDIRVDCYASGLDIGYWNDSSDWVSWSAAHVSPGDYSVFVRTSSLHGSHSFSLKVADKQLQGKSLKTTDWEEYRDAPLGQVHIEAGESVAIEFHPDPQGWGPTNLSAVRLVPVDRGGSKN